jgi:hypothetical protein
MIYGERSADLFEHLRLLVNPPDQQGQRRPGLILEREADATEAEQPLEEIARVDLRIVVFAADLLAAFRGPDLDVRVVGRDLLTR